MKAGIWLKGFMYFRVQRIEAIIFEKNVTPKRGRGNGVAKIESLIT